MFQRRQLKKHYVIYRAGFSNLVFCRCVVFPFSPSWISILDQPGIFNWQKNREEWGWQLYRNFFKSGEVYVLQLTISGNRSLQTPDPSSVERNNDKQQEPQRIWYIVLTCSFFLMDLDSTISSNCNKPMGWNVHSQFGIWIWLLLQVWFYLQSK